MTLAEIQKQYWDTLSKTYDKREAVNITKIVLEKVLEASPLSMALDRFRLLTSYQSDTLQRILTRLINNEPVQYVLGEVYFFDLMLEVTPDVLIPRPETEELVEWIVSEWRNTEQVSILDIGTGSGCIAIALSSKLPHAIVDASDVSPMALDIAIKNNTKNNTSVRFFNNDVLKEPLTQNTYNIVVSNPPYINLNEQAEIKANVLRFEPHLALFAPGTDDLIFYKKIAEQAANILEPNGKIYLEINASKGKEVCELLKKKGYTQIELRNDLSGKPRMVCATKKA